MKNGSKQKLNQQPMLSPRQVRHQINEAEGIKSEALDSITLAQNIILAMDDKIAKLKEYKQAQKN